ncbi:hypothetical protein GUITHDRAFT_131756 [Guillardia theta CCMP2712]|uniref:Pentacotripeptide-repeat region of PRORP domain-containing protein n=1 Tax=Guillardia theta (strain CCMP2712) TaxID=905079 RepID=L1K2N0_GUITC|nr:hypothetical protein GUITHDRAFT_131756 [Guillardia theta CCMP2712]EKX54715.1 hypothetical protein GUITHDRAFT_131756 [Guillardia theta CCMP2712]|eukprot:XP_005841695.1 hypothetical protein GUITHDRAFT_131756 [Guillardia theta CCMP2712]
MLTFSRLVGVRGIQLLVLLLSQVCLEGSSDMVASRGADLSTSPLWDKPTQRNVELKEENDSLQKRKGKKTSRKKLLRRLAKLQMKIDEHENRCEKLIEMTDVGRNFTVNEASNDGSDSTEIDPQRWLVMERKRISRLYAYRSKLEDMYDRQFGNDSDLDSVDDSEKEIPWAECGGPINCSYPQETEEDADLVPPQLFLKPGKKHTDPLLRLCGPNDGAFIVPGPGFTLDRLKLSFESTCHGSIDWLSAVRTAGEDSRTSMQSFRQISTLWGYCKRDLAVVTKKYQTDLHFLQDLSHVVEAYNSQEIGSTWMGIDDIQKIWRPLGGSRPPSAKFLRRRTPVALSDHVRAIERLISTGHADKALFAFLEVVKRKIVVVKDDHVMHVIRLFGNARRADCADIALQEASTENLVLEEKVKQDGIKPSCFIYNIIIAAYASDPHVSQVLSLAWMSSLTPNKSTLMLVIEMCGRSCSGQDWVGLLEAYDIPLLARNLSIEVDEEILYGILDCCRVWMAANKTCPFTKVLDTLTMYGQQTEDECIGSRTPSSSLHGRHARGGGDDGYDGDDEDAFMEMVVVVIPSSIDKFRIFLVWLQIVHYRMSVEESQTHPGIHPIQTPLSSD